MEDRCKVETWAEFCPAPTKSGLLSWGETDTLLVFMGEEVLVFNTQELKLTVNQMWNNWTPIKLKHVIRRNNKATCLFRISPVDAGN